MIPLRGGRHFAVTWTVGRTFGGMTGAMLQRSRAFVRLCGVEVTVLTFDSCPDYPGIEAALRKSGHLPEGIRLLNIYDWIREQAEIPRAKNAGAGFQPIDTAETPDDDATVTYREGAVYTRTRFTADGASTLQVDHYRADGTLAVSDRRDTRAHGVPGGRRVTLCDATGAPARSFAGAWALYHWWLDRVRAGEQATCIVDSKTSARFMIEYRRRDVLTLHVVHASHLNGPGQKEKVRASRRQVFEQPGAFDGLVFLTERQRQDARSLLGDLPNLLVIPNSSDRTHGNASGPTPPRPSTRGVMLASLDSRKRVEHGIRAVVKARTAGHPVTLDVYGEGPGRAAAEAEAAAAGGAVTLHGFRIGAVAELPRASFLLLTSRDEGLPLVLIECMAAGCIPIAYDIEYGPADIIRDRLNGFLVKAGDIDELAVAIARLQSLPPARIAAMRRAAARTATHYSDETVTRIWAREIDHAAMRRGYLPAGRPRAAVFRLRRALAWRLRRLRKSLLGATRK